jgi:hypothetical protein
MMLYWYTNRTHISSEFMYHSVHATQLEESLQSRQPKRAYHRQMISAWPVRLPPLPQVLMTSLSINSVFKEILTAIEVAHGYFIAQCKFVLEDLGEEPIWDRTFANVTEVD